MITYFGNPCAFLKKAGYAFLMFFFLTNCLLGQESIWSKSQREALFSDFIALLNKSNSINQELKENIAICCIEEVSKNYSPAVYNSKLDVELNRIKSTTLNGCIQKFGVTLDKQNSSADGTTNFSKSWSKENRFELFNEILNILNQYPLNQNIRETVCLCFVNRVTVNNDKTALDSKLPLEVQKIKRDALTFCLDSLRIKLQPKSTAPPITLQSIAGMWKSYNYTLYLYPDGEMEKDPDGGIFNRKKGKWFLESDKIIFFLKGNKEEYKITYYTGETMKIEEVNTKTVFHLTKQAGF